MFDDLIRALEELEAGVALSVPFQIDDDGYFDRQCPWSSVDSPSRSCLRIGGTKFLMSGHTALSAATRRSRPNSIHLSKLNI
jgi:hypothetical protein